MCKIKSSSIDINMKNSPHKIPKINCHACGAENSAFVANCWICHAPVSEEDEVVEAVLVPSSEETRKNQRTKDMIALLIFFILVPVANVIYLFALCFSGNLKLH